MLRFENYDDAVYAHTSYLKMLQRDGDKLARAWLTDRHNKYGKGASTPSAVAWQHAYLDAVNADILWMTTEMMDLTQVAMESFDPAEPMRPEDVFVPNGFMVLPHPFMGEDQHGKRTAWRAIGWQFLDPMGSIVPEDLLDADGRVINLPPGELAISATQSKERVYVNRLYEGYEAYPGVRFMLLAYSDDEDDFYDPELVDLALQQGWDMGVVHATAMPLELVHIEGETTGEGDLKAAWLRFWRVAQKLMSERIVVSERRQPGRQARKDASRFQLPPPVLRVVELRRPHEREENGHEREPGRWTHRWIVRGHWRNQWYRSENRHRQIWIHAYEKGPDDLDLIVKRRVWNWDR